VPNLISDGKLTALPRPLAVFKVTTSNRREGKEEVREQEGREARKGRAG